jgi:hypothetical protein
LLIVYQVCRRNYLIELATEKQRQAELVALELKRQAEVAFKRKKKGFQRFVFHFLQAAELLRVTIRAQSIRRTAVRLRNNNSSFAEYKTAFFISDEWLDRWLSVCMRVWLLKIMRCATKLL